MRAAKRGDRQGRPNDLRCLNHRCFRYVQVDLPKFCDFPTEDRVSLPSPCRRRKRPMPAEVHLFACLKDNYGVLLHDPSTGTTASIDAPEAAPVEAALSERGWRLTDILVTHHHADHTGGIADLKKKYLCRVVAPRKEASKIQNIDVTVREGD